VPQHARGAQLGDFHEEVHADGEEEDRRPANLSMSSPRPRRTHIFHAVGDGEGQFLHLRRAGFLHVVAGDRDRVELRHLAAGVAEDVRDDPHRGFGRIDVGVADHELLEDVVLDGPVQQLAVDALLLARDDEEGQDRDHRAVHRHRHRHLVERDAVEQDLHVLDRVDGDARLADIAHHARVVAVIAAVGGQVEGDRQALLPGGEVAAVEGVRFLGGGEAGVLPDRPGRPAYMLARTPRVNGAKPGRPGSTVASSAV
jgi:hypothetical protein